MNLEKYVLTKLREDGKVHFAAAAGSPEHSPQEPRQGALLQRSKSTVQREGVLAYKVQRAWRARKARQCLHALRQVWLQLHKSCELCGMQMSSLMSSTTMTLVVEHTLYMPY